MLIVLFLYFILYVILYFLVSFVDELNFLEFFTMLEEFLIYLRAEYKKIRKMGFQALVQNIAIWIIHSYVGYQVFRIILDYFFSDDFQMPPNLKNCRSDEIGF